MITKDEVFDMAMRTSLHIMATPHAPDIVSKLELLILDAYERGMNDTANKMLEASTQIDMDEVLGRAQ